MATKVFRVGNMASQDVQSYVGSCKFYASDNAAEIHDGAVVALDGLCVDATYASESGDPVDPIYDYNCYKAVAPSSADAADVVFVDLVAVSNGDILGNNYKIGEKIVGLTAPAGYAVRFRRPVKGDVFWIGAGNFGSGTPAVGAYGHVTADATTFTANSTAASAKIKVIAEKPLIVGATREGTESLYLVEVL